MPVNLHITFAGMCMFVHDAERMHVLLPQPKHAHTALIVYRKRHEVSSAGPRELVKLPFEGSWLDLTMLPRNGAPDKFHPNVVDLTTRLRKKVKRNVLANLGGSADVRAWVTMATGTWHDHFPGGRWTLAGSAPDYMALWEERRLTNVGTRPDGRSDEVFELKIQGANAVRKLLKPITGEDGAVHLYVLHVPPREIPREAPVLEEPRDEPPDRYQAAHFTAFYRLVTPQKPETAPLYRKGKKGARMLSRRVKRTLAGREFTCILSRADPE